MANQSRVTRKHINLVRRKIGKKNMNGLVWFIGLHKNGKIFYVTDYDDDNNTIMWASKKDGITFTTEKSVQKFIHKHLHDRNDIFLIQAPNS